MLVRLMLQYVFLLNREIKMSVPCEICSKHNTFSFWRLVCDKTEIEYTDAKQSNCQNAAGEKFIFPSHKSIQALLDSVIHVGQDFRYLDLPH